MNQYALPFGIVLSLSFSAQAQEPPPPPTLPSASRADAINAGMRSPEEIQYWRALENRSTAHSLVVITLNLPHGQIRRCIEAPFLLGAIYREYRLPYSKYGEAQVLKIALKARQAPITLKKSAAINNIPITYGDKEFQWVKSYLQKYSNKQIVEMMTDHTGEPLEAVVWKLAPRTGGNYSMAMAHVLYERGLNVGRGCVDSSIWVSE